MPRQPCEMPYTKASIDIHIRFCFRIKFRFFRFDSFLIISSSLTGSSLAPYVCRSLNFCRFLCARIGGQFSYYSYRLKDRRFQFYRFCRFSTFSITSWTGEDSGVGWGNNLVGGGRYFPFRNWSVIDFRLSAYTVMHFALIRLSLAWVIFTPR